MIRPARLLLLTFAFALAASGAAAQGDAPPMEGDMRGIVLHEEPRAASMAAFLGADGTETSLAAYEGRYVLLNFWATWCAPCREEMPALDALQRELGGEDFAVVTLATGRNAPAAIDRFFEEEGIESLPTYRDPQQAVAREMAVLGLPITVLVDPEGREVARMRGEADWASPEALAFLRAMIGRPMADG